jgi:hypothetical protein
MYFTYRQKYTEDINEEWNVLVPLICMRYDLRPEEEEIFIYLRRELQQLETPVLI